MPTKTLLVILIVCMGLAQPLRAEEPYRGEIIPQEKELTLKGLSEQDYKLALACHEASLFTSAFKMDNIEIPLEIFQIGIKFMRKRYNPSTNEKMIEYILLYLKQRHNNCFAWSKFWKDFYD